MSSEYFTISFPVILQNRQIYNQLLGNSNAALEKTAPSKMPGKGRGKGETRPNFKDNLAATSSVKERVSNNFELFKAFVTRFIRLNGILFMRTRFANKCLVNNAIF